MITQYSLASLVRFKHTLGKVDNGVTMGYAILLTLNKIFDYISILFYCSLEITLNINKISAKLPCYDIHG